MKLPSGPVRTVVAALLVAQGLAACGDDGAGPKMTGAAPPPRKGGPAKSAAPAAAPTATVIERQVSPKWEALRPYFDKFANQPLLTHKDTFRDNLVKHVPKVDLPSLEPKEELLPPIEEAPLPVQEDVATGPLERYAASEYHLVMILSGTVIPKAVVLDPIGNAWVVQKDARFGNKNGIVQDITQYAMIIQEPDQDAPLEKTIKPGIFDVAVDIMAGDNEARLTAAPIIR